ncbi:MAG: VanW family protein [Actinomycetota bacterium]|nr:VanW family protein [Actinomycetota bacterium]
MSTQRRMIYLTAGMPLGLILLLVAAWGIDATVSGDRVMRGMTIAGTPADGLDDAELRAIASDLTAQLADQPVEVAMGDASADSDPVTLGVRVDADALVERALTARRDGFFIARPFRWLGSFFSDHNVDPPYAIDDAAVAAAAQELIDTHLAKPIEPTLEVEADMLILAPGIDGATFEPTQLAAALPAMMEQGPPFALKITPDVLESDIDIAALEAVASEANEATESGLTVRVLDDVVAIAPAQLRAWVDLDTEGTEPRWLLDEQRMLADLGPAFPSLGGADKQAHFEISNGRPIIIPPAGSLSCCEPGSAAAVQDALLEGSAEIALEPVIAGGGEGVAALETLGIIEEVSTFTTNHKCCENRVTNIHLMADLVRGTIVRPGETFSLNGHVRERTQAKGFVSAGAIAQGVLEDQVGGGVSQFATTIFNAAFFAGMELLEYQSHSLYFSRYPRGREATVSWPKPDFRFRNDTPYGILIWASYTDTSITVALYSTKNITVEDLGQRDSARGMCTRVTTTRQRTWADGRTETDTVFAVYRPSEGLDCNGNPTRPTTTTVPPPADPNATTTTSDPSADTTTTGPPPTSEGE